MKSMYYTFFLIIQFCCSNTQENQTQQITCEWCGTSEAPENTTWHTTIANNNEKGDRIKISGTVYTSDKKTPVSQVVLYFYHTNIEKRGNEIGNGKRHGYLRSWIKTGDDGKYSFETIKPEPYPGRSTPAHIHITVKEPDKKEYWLKDYFFEGDDLLSAKDIENETGEERFNHVLSLTKQGKILVGKRDILLKD